MDALSILALGVAQAGGGGGGTSDYSDLSNKPQINNVTLSGNKSLSDLGIPSYTAGDGIDITNNEISVDLERDGGLDVNQDGELNVNWSQADISLEQEHQSQESYSTYNFNTSGFRGERNEYDVDMGDYLPATSAKMDGGSVDVRVRHVMDDYNDEIKITGTGIEFVNETEDKVLSITSDGDLDWDGTTLATMGDIPAAELPTIESGDAGKVLTVNSGETGVEWATGGGGSSSGAVRYDEAQTLTDEQKNQAKANQELPYVSFTKTASKENYSYGTGTAAQSINMHTSFNNIPSPTTIGYKLYITVSDTAHGFEESAVGHFTNTSGRFSFENETGMQFFDVADTNCYLGSSQLVFTKLDTSALSLSYNLSYSVFVDVPTYNNEMNAHLIDSDFLHNVRATFNGNPAGWLVVQPDSDNSNYKVAGLSNFVVGNRNKVDGNVSGACVVGNTNKVWSNTAPYALIGYNNETNSSAPNKASSLIGYSLITTQSQNSTVIGKCNESTSKYLPFSYSATYNQGDCVTRWQSNYQPAVYRCLADNTTGQYPPSSGTGSNDYWEYVDNGTSSSYLFVIGNGSDNSNRSNALTVDWSGNLVCNNIPPCPSADGVYNLQVSIVSGVPTYSWVAQS